jgi:translation elongation factor EF-Ts
MSMLVHLHICIAHACKCVELRKAVSAIAMCCKKSLRRNNNGHFKPALGWLKEMSHLETQAANSGTSHTKSAVTDL